MRHSFSPGERKAMRGEPTLTLRTVRWTMRSGRAVMRGELGVEGGSEGAGLCWTAEELWAAMAAWCHRG